MHLAKPLRQSQRKRVSRKMHKTSGSIAFDDFIAVISDFSFSFCLGFLLESCFGLATHQLRIRDINMYIYIWNVLKNGTGFQASCIDMIDRIDRKDRIHIIDMKHVIDMKEHIDMKDIIDS